MKENKFTFSVFTCTYNRKDTIHRTFNSLVNQTYKNFEWIVFDNGSTDNTMELLEQWKLEAEFPIVILRWDLNTGYQNTFNEGVKIARGEFWIMLDSDDECFPNALGKFTELWYGIPEKKRDKFTGVTVNCVDQFGNLVGKEFPSYIIDTDYVEGMYKYKITGEKWGFNRVDVLKQFPFPDTSNHVMPGLVWRELGKKYKTRFVNETLRIYYIEEVNRKDQLSFHLAMSEHSAYSRWITSLTVLNCDMGWFWYHPVRFVKSAIVHVQFSKYRNLGFKDIMKGLKGYSSKIIVLTTYPIGLFLYIVNK